MKNEFKIGQKVVAPVTDSEGETKHVVGELVSLNSRWAVINVNGEQTRVGCTKIEHFVVKAPAKKNKAGTVTENPSVCPSCGSKDVMAYHDAENEEQAATFSREYGCLACGHDYGRKIRRSVGRIADDYMHTYTKVKAASGRASCDNNDKVAEMLREKTLDQVYYIVAKTTGIKVDVLSSLYQHLNPGQQRMCLGNRLRGWMKKNGG